jgi:hypothetical protein
MLPLITDPMYSSLALVVLAGLTVGTIITLILLPIFYALLFCVKTPVQKINTHKYDTEKFNYSINRLLDMRFGTGARKLHIGKMQATGFGKQCQSSKCATLVRSGRAS